MHEIKNITITPEIASEKLTSLRRIATIESVGSSTRIEGARLSDAEVEKFLSGLRSESIASRDEQEVAGYADATGNWIRRQKPGRGVRDRDTV
jgi:hypothetical protein